MAGDADGRPANLATVVMKHGTLILCYHRVAEGVADPFHLCVDPASFAAHLEELVRRREPCTLSDLARPSRRPRVVVTFDDGYSDNLHHALPIAEAKGVPITVFVTSGMVGTTNGFWWDRLAAVLRARPTDVREIPLAIPGNDVTVPLGTGGLDADLHAVRRHLIALAVPEIEGVLDAVSARWSVASAAPPDARALTPDELRQLAASQLVTIGAHTVDHVRLGGRPPADQLRTIAASKTELEAAIGGAVAHFAYPFGRQGDFDDASVAAVEQAGFETACTSLPGTARPSSNRALLPRRLVMNWGRGRFRAQLQRWRLG